MEHVLPRLPACPGALTSWSLKAFEICHPWEFRTDSLERMIFHPSFEELSREGREGHSSQGGGISKGAEHGELMGSGVCWVLYVPVLPSPGQHRGPAMTLVLDEIQVSKKPGRSGTEGQVPSQGVGPALSLISRTSDFGELKS